MRPPGKLSRAVAMNFFGHCYFGTPVMISPLRAAVAEAETAEGDSAPDRAA